MTTQARTIAFWKAFYRGLDTGMIARLFECREHEVYNAMGKTRGTALHRKAIAA